MPARRRAERLEAAPALQGNRTEPAPAARLSAAPGRSGLLPRILTRPWAPLLLLIANAALALARPPLAGIDTPALAAAWEIVRTDDWLLWQSAAGEAGGVAPVLPWMIALAWSALGEGAAAARVLTALALAAALLASRRLAERLWPHRADAGPLASWAFAGSAGVALLGPAIMPEVVGCALVACGLLGIATAAEGRRLGWLLFGGSLAMLLPTVGAAALWALAAPALLAPAWMSQRSRWGWLGWYAHLSFAAAGAALPLAWIAGAAGGLDGISSWMMSAHAPSLLPLLAVPFFFYPWPFWPRFWRSARRQSAISDDAGVRVCGIALLASVAGLVVEGAGVARLLLVAPAACALIARLLAGRLPGRADFHAGIPALPLALLGAVPIVVNTVPWAQLANRARELAGAELPIWLADLGVGGAMLLLGGTFLLIQGTPRLMLSRAAHIALLPTLLSAALAWEMNGAVGRAFDLAPMAARIAELQSRNAPVAAYEINPSNYAFAGRLDQPLAPLATRDEALDWARRHPGGAVLAPVRGSVLHLTRQPSYAAPQGSSWVALWPAQAVLEANGAVLGEADR
jgi:hypothetical protein